MKKALILAIYSLLSAIFFVAFLPAGQATVLGVGAGDLIKLKNDHDPATHEDEAVYYLDKDWFRHPFPNLAVYRSWYRDFSGVKEISMEAMAEFRLAMPVAYRPGTRLVKIPSVPKVYAVEPGGALRWIESEAVAVSLYGPQWAKRVDDVSEALLTAYHEGTPLTAPVWPTGTVVRRNSDTAMFFIDGIRKFHLMQKTADALHIAPSDVIATGNDLAMFADAGEMPDTGHGITDASQIDRLETLPPPQFDFPARLTAADRGPDQQLYALRLTAGAPIILRRLRIAVTGALAGDGTPLISDFRFTDMAGENLFGTVQMTDADPSGRLEFSGAYTILENTQAVIVLRGDVALTAVAGTVVTVTMDTDGILISEGVQSDVLTGFGPKSAYPVSRIVLK